MIPHHIKFIIITHPAIRLQSVWFTFVFNDLFNFVIKNVINNVFNFVIDNMFNFVLNNVFNFVINSVFNNVFNNVFDKPSDNLIAHSDCNLKTVKIQLWLAIPLTMHILNNHILYNNEKYTISDIIYVCFIITICEAKPPTLKRS
jgi:hypothetical protein